MKKLSHLTRVSILLACFFGVDKVLGIARQMIITRQFGLSSELDAFNAANNLPDMLYALISGGALAIAFIPVLSEVLTRDGRPAAWQLFSRIANLSFLVTGAFAVVIAVLAEPLVGWQLGIAPGFTLDQQRLVAELMRLNLAATLIFSLSGLMMAGLQANQHFLLPAVAPLLYNIGQIFGAVVLSPTRGISLGPVHLPAFGLGVHGLLYGVIIGAALHLAVQIPGLLKYQFRWAPSIDLSNPAVRQVLKLMGPRVLTMLFIQLVFMARDNLASRLDTGSVTALTLGWMLMQVPETLIGTAIGTALLPTLAEQIARNDLAAFKATIERAGRVLIALTLPVAAVLACGLAPLVKTAFGLPAAENAVVVWVSQAYLAGLMGHSLMEVAARSFYARQDARIPLFAAALNVAAFALLAFLFLKPLGAFGIAISNSLAYTGEAALLFFLLNRRLPTGLKFGGALLRAALAACAGAAVTWLVLQIPFLPLPAVVLAFIALAFGALAALPIVWQEVRQLVSL
jgi:putative peptidoglycan lipid II flippase